MPENVPSQLRIDDKTRAEFAAMGLSDKEMSALEETLGSITADTIAQFMRIKDAVRAMDFSTLDDEDTFFAMQILREVYNRSTPEEQAVMLKSMRSNRE